MTKAEIRQQQELQNDLLGAALRYAAVADWFEGQPCTWHKKMKVEEAMAIFNCVEAELRVAADRVLRKNKRRELILLAAGVPEVAG